MATHGGIFSFGDAAFHGSTGAMRLNKPIVGMDSTPQGGGYYLVTSDRGIFTFGNAAFRGSAGNIRLNSPIVGMARSRSGNGYQLVATDGGIFNYGDSRFFGSTGNIRLNQPVLGMDIRPALAVSVDAFGTSDTQSSEWTDNGAGDFRLVLNDRIADGVPAGARILGVEGLGVDQIGPIGFTLESGTCEARGPQFLLSYDTNGNAAGGESTFDYVCTGGPGGKSLTPEAPAEVPASRRSRRSTCSMPGPPRQWSSTTSRWSG